jgi:hypothetical protein
MKCDPQGKDTQQMAEICYDECHVFVMLCYVMLCYVMLCYVLLLFVMLSVTYVECLI